MLSLAWFAILPFQYVAGLVIMTARMHSWASEADINGENPPKSSGLVIDKWCTNAYAWGQTGLCTQHLNVSQNKQLQTSLQL